METDELRTRLALVRDTVAAASEGRYPAPRIVAVTKTRPPEMILPLAGMGITEIGENHVQ